MSIPLLLLGLTVITIALVSLTRGRTAPATRRNASADDGFSPDLLDGGSSGSAHCGDGAGADGGGCDGGSGGD